MLGRLLRELAFNDLMLNAEYDYASKDDIVVEMKSGKSEEAVLLQGVNGDKKFPNDQVCNPKNTSCS